MKKPREAMNLDCEILKKYDVSEDGFIDLHEYVAAQPVSGEMLGVLRTTTLLCLIAMILLCFKFLGLTEERSYHEAFLLKESKLLFPSKMDIIFYTFICSFPLPPPPQKTNVLARLLGPREENSTSRHHPCASVRGDDVPRGISTS